jgi:superfamily II DNA or RNA helicase
MIFCVDIQHAIDVAEQFKLNELSCEAVSSNEELTPGRSEKINLFKRGKIQSLSNVGILTTGFDHPDTGCIIMACPTKSLTKYLQSVGRGSRLKSKEYVDKFGQNCIVIDIVDATVRHSLINAWELDKQKPIEERTFVTAENKEKLLLERQKRSVKIEHQRNEDERVNLLAIPKVKIKTSWRMEGEATQAQLNVIKEWGYDIENVTYTKFQVAEIFDQRECSEKQRNFLKWKGYDVSGFISIAQAREAFKEIESKEAEKQRKERNNQIKQNNPFKL